MVHQLSLFGSLDDDSYDLFVATMSILSGTPPVIFATVSNVWKTNEKYEFEKVNSKNQLTELNRMRLSRDLPLRLFKENKDQSTLSYKLLKDIAKSEMPMPPASLKSFLLQINYERASQNTDDSEMDVDNPKKPDEDQESWCLSMSDIPAAGNSRKVSMQTISQSIILSTGGVDSSTSSFLRESGYVPDFQYVTVGVKFYMVNDLVLEIQKIWDINENRSLQVSKGGFLVKAHINVNRATDIERINQAEAALLALQKELQGYVELSVPDRKAMDSRLDYINDIL